MAQKEATQKRLNMSIAFQNKLMETLNERVQTRAAGDRPQGRHQDRSLRRQGRAGKVAVAAGLRPGPADRDRRGAQRVAQREGQGDLAVHRRQREQARRRRAQGRRSASGARQGGRAPRSHPAFAPIDGVVQQLAVTTVGQVVTTGQQLLVRDAERGASCRSKRWSPISTSASSSSARTRSSRSTPSRSRASARCTARSSTSPPQPSPSRTPSARSPTPPRPPMRRRSATSAPGQPESFVFPVTVSLDETSMKIDNATIP